MPARVGAAGDHPVPIIPIQLDHLVYATPDLTAAVAHIAEQLGVLPEPGGRHPGWGTWNSILPVGPASYLEIIGPDPANPSDIRPDIFGIAALGAPRLATWAAKSDDLTAVIEGARSLGVDLGSSSSGRRVRPDGTVLSWELTDPFKPRAGGVVPFFIRWGNGGHPSVSGSHRVALVDFRAQHPDPATVGGQLRGLGIGLEVAPGPAPALLAALRGPRGVVTLM